MNTTLFISHLHDLIALDAGLRTATDIPFPCSRPEETNDLIFFLTYHEIATDVSAAYQRHGLYRIHDRYRHLHEQLKPVYYATMARQLLYTTITKDAIRLLDHAGIPALPLKGMSQYLSSGTRPRARALCDIDILIKPEHVETAELVLTQNGYTATIPAAEREYWRTQQMHLKFMPCDAVQPVTIELHWALDYPRRYPMLPQLWNRIHTVPVDGTLIRLLSPEDTLFVLALHGRRFGKPLILKYAFDIIEILKAHGNQLDIAYLLAEARHSRLQSCLSLLLQQVLQYYHHAALETVISGLNVGFLKQRYLFPLLVRKSLHPQTIDAHKRLFAAIHAVSFDTWREPVLYMLNIPFKQFCDYFGLTQEGRWARYLHATRILWYPIYGAQVLLAGILRFIAGNCICFLTKALNVPAKAFAFFTRRSKAGTAPKRSA